MGWNFAFTSLDYGDQWRSRWPANFKADETDHISLLESRALFTQQFSPSSLKMYQKPCLQEGMYVFLNSLLDSPKEFANHLRLCVSSNLLLFGSMQIDVLHIVLPAEPSYPQHMEFP